MRHGVQAFVVAALGLSALVATSAFTYSDVTPRAIAVSIVGDGAAYLSLAANPSSPHDCFVTQTAGETSISFAATTGDCGGNGGGTGINPGGTGTKHSRYAFHDLLLVKNLGTKSVQVYVNATTTSGSDSSIQVAKEPSTGQMTVSDYAATSATSLSLGPGGTFYVGVLVDTGRLTSGSVAGHLTVEAIKG